MRTSRKGLQLIKSFEGFRPRAARLADGRWTIGYGHVRSAREGAQVTEQDAEHLLRYDLQAVEAAISEWTLTPLNQNEFDALASLALNISPGQFKDSEILRRLNAGDHIAAAHAFDAWRRARVNGRLIVVDALVRRRTAEKALFLEPMHRRPAAPTPIITPELDLAAAIVSSKAAPVDVSTDLLSDRAEALASTPDPFQDERALGEAVADLAAATGGSPADDPQAAAAIVSARIAELFSDTERPAAERVSKQPNDDEAAPVTAARRRPDATTKREAPDLTAPEPPAAQPEERMLIDDTEILDPGLDAALASAIGRDEAEDEKPAVFEGLAPWGVVVLGALILMMIGGRDFAARLQSESTVSGDPGAMIFLTGAMTFVMGMYFWIGKRFLRPA